MTNLESQGNCTGPRVITALKAAFERATIGNLELVLVTGYAGIGKTALVREALQQMTIGSTNLTIHLGMGRFDPIHKDIPYSAIAQAVREVVRQILVKNDKEVDNWRIKLASALGRNVRVIADIIPEIEVILGPQEAVGNIGPLEAGIV